MSHPVFLNATSHPRMPDGSSREWEAFFLEGGPELEANAFIPLLWMALYTPMDLHWARLIDDEDLDSDAREDMMDYGDTQYPYLVTSLERALAVLAQRAPLLVARLEAVSDVDVAPIVDNFARHLRLHYGPYVLCRTSGLPDVEDFGPELQKALEDFDALTRAGDAGSDNVIVAEINNTRALLRPDRVHLLTGHGHDFTQAEPEPDVMAVELPVDADVAAPATTRVDTPASAPSSTVRSQQPPRRENKLIGWLVAVAVGVPTVLAYQTTGSVWIAGILFLLLCAAAGWFMKRKA